jgi:hypothetical protein
MGERGFFRTVRRPGCDIFCVLFTPQPFRRTWSAFRIIASGLTIISIIFFIEIIAAVIAILIAMLSLTIIVDLVMVIVLVKTPLARIAIFLTAGFWLRLFDLVPSNRKAIVGTDRASFLNLYE